MRISSLKVSADFVPYFKRVFDLQCYPPMTDLVYQNAIGSTQTCSGHIRLKGGEITNCLPISINRGLPY